MKQQHICSFGDKCNGFKTLIYSFFFTKCINSISTNVAYCLKLRFLFTICRLANYFKLNIYSLVIKIDFLETCFTFLTEQVCSIIAGPPVLRSLHLEVPLRAEGVRVPNAFQRVQLDRHFVDSSRKLLARHLRRNVAYQIWSSLH
jgi:hypothetical protein